MRVFLALLVSLILALGARSEAVARAEMAGARDQALCGAQAVVTLDATGHVLHRRACTHCLVAGLSCDLAAESGLAMQLQARGVALIPLRVTAGPAKLLPGPTARAPPLSRS